MKKTLFTFMAALSAIAITSCQKTAVPSGEEGDGGKDLAAPSIVWPSNESFATVDIDDKLDATLTIAAPAGIETLVVTVESDVLESSLGMMGLSSELDLVNDEKVAGILETVAPDLPTGEAVKGKTEVEFDITSLVKLIDALTLKASDHSFKVKVGDAAGKTAEKTCTFHRTELAAPSITWPSNESFATVDIDDNLDASLVLAAPAGIETLVVTVESAALAQVLATMGLSTELDLVNDAKVIEAFKTLAPELPTGDALKGKTEAEFDITSLVKSISEVSKEEADHSFTIVAGDTNGNSIEKTCTFHSLAPAVSNITITWPGNESFDVFEFTADNKPQPVHISAPAGIKGITVAVEAEKQAYIDDIIKFASGAGTEVIDLVNDETSIQSELVDGYGFDFIAPSLDDMTYGKDAIVGKTELDLNLNGLLEITVCSMYSLLYAGSVNLTVKVEDNDGSVSQVTCKYLTK